MTECIGNRLLGSRCAPRPAYRVRAVVDDAAATHLVCADHLAAVICALDVECSVAFLDIDVGLDEEPTLPS